MKLVKKNLLFVALAAVVVALSSCTMYRSSMVRTKYPPVPTKIPNVNHETKATCMIAGQDFDIIEKTINDELTTNIISTENEPKGFMEIICDKYTLKLRPLIPFFSGFTLFSLNIVGFPISYVEIGLRLKINIYDNSHNLIKNYSYEVTDKSAMGFYYGRGGRVVLVDVTKKALDNFRKDIEHDAQFITEKLDPNAKPQTIIQQKAEPIKNVKNDDNTALKPTIIRWDIQSKPQDADVFWRVVSETTEVKNSSNKYLSATPYEASKTLDIKGLTYQNADNVSIIIRCEKDGYIPQEKEFDIQTILDMEEISTFFRLVKEE